LGVVLTVSAKAGPAEPTLTITLRVLNYAEVSEKTLIQAEKEVTKIFHKIDVETSWFHIPVPSGEEPSNSPSAPPVSSPGVHLSISIYPQSMAKPLEERLANMDHVFGFAPRTEDEPGRWIYIFYHRVEELVQKQRLLEHKARILGLAMAHEIGHLLLPFHSHSPRGIMRARWDRQDFQLATYGNLDFTPKQAELIRSEVQRKGGLDPKR
jgi:hypothetical protein